MGSQVKKEFPFFARLLALLIFIGQFLLLRKTFFFHDEWTLLHRLITAPAKFIFTPLNEHFLPLFNLFYLIQYRLFGLNYPFYQFILLLFHFANAYLLFLIIRRLTKNRNLGVLAFFLFIINSLYWEVIFAAITQAIVFCLFFTGLALLFYLKKNFALSAFFSLLSIYCWGINLFLPSLFLILLVLRRPVKPKEALPYLFTQAISLATYFSFSQLPATEFNFQDAFAFTLAAVKAMILGFYTASPGRMTYFLVFATFFAFFLFSTLRKSKKKIKKNILPHLPFLVFSLATFLYIFLLLGFSRAPMGLELAASSRYTYLPLFFLIIINLLLFDALLPFFSKKNKFFLILYLFFFFTNHLYFFKIYYRNWLETIVRPNQKIYQEIINTPSTEELPPGKLPPNFHSLFSAQEIYEIYQKSR